MWTKIHESCLVWFHQTMCQLHTRFRTLKIVYESAHGSWVMALVWLNTFRVLEGRANTLGSSLSKRERERERADKLAWLRTLKIAYTGFVH